MALMNVTVKMPLKMCLNMPTIALSTMTERSGCRQMSEHAPSIVIKPRSLSADPSVTGKPVAFHSGYYPYLLLGSAVPSQQIPTLLFDICLHVITSALINRSVHLAVISVWAFLFSYCLALWLTFKNLHSPTPFFHPF
jgi:hypothetical protein